VLVTRLPALVKRQSTTGSIALPLLLLRYITTCQRCPGIARSMAFPMLTIGTVGPAAIGTLPTGLGAAVAIDLVDDLGPDLAKSRFFGPQVGRPVGFIDLGCAELVRDDGMPELEGRPALRVVCPDAQQAHRNHAGQQQHALHDPEQRRSHFTSAHATTHRHRPSIASVGDKTRA
jgi:hypothetical protein